MVSYLQSCLLMRRCLGEKEEKMVEALFLSAGIGEVIAENASIAGAAGGCQAEIGSASAMAAAANCLSAGWQS